MLVETKFALAEVAKNLSNVTVRNRSQNQLIFKIAKKGGSEELEAAFLCEEVLGKSLKRVEEKSCYLIGIFDGKICAAASLTKEENLFQITNIAVAAEMQNKGIGSELLKFCENFVAENAVAAIYCRARDSYGRSAVNFFIKNQFFCRGDEFEDGGIVTQIMLKLLG
jgi:ribosomal protein S18 acetylase RimI-like enzyme